MAQNNELNAALTRIALPAIGTATTLTVPGPWFKRGSRLKMMSLLSAAAIAADAVNKVTIVLKKLDGTVLASISTDPAAQGAAAQYVPLPAAPADLDLDLDIGLATKLDITTAGTATVAIHTVVQIDHHNR